MKPDLSFLNPIAFLATVVFLFNLLSCTDEPNSTDNQTSYEVHLVGKVLTKDGNPVPNAVAHLKEFDVSDTTDSKGEYTIAVPAGLSKRAAGAVDSLLITRDEQLLTTMEVLNYIDTMPDVFIVQRDFSGMVDSGSSAFDKIEAVVWNNGNDSIKKTVELYYSPVSRRYSGFIYFIYSGAEEHYFVYINVYNFDTVFVGRSDTVDFSSMAGDIEIPTFRPIAEWDTVIISDETVFGELGPNRIYHAVVHIKIPYDSTLTIHKNTTVILDSAFYIEGRLVTLGDTGALVTIHSNFEGNDPFHNKIQGGRCILNYTVFDINGTFLPYGDSIILSNCVFGNNSCLSIYGAGVWSIINCLFYNIRTQPAIILDPALSTNPCKIVNTIITDVDYGIFLYTHAGDVPLEFSNNCIHNSTKYDFVSDTVPPLPPLRETLPTFLPDMTTSLTSDPMITSLEQGKEDFHLQSGSPCKTSGKDGQEMGIYGRYSE